MENNYEEDLTHGDLMTRLLIVHELHSLGAGALPWIDQLEVTLDDNFPQVSIAAGFAIGSIGSGAIGTLPKILEISKEDSVRGGLFRSGMFGILGGLLPPATQRIGWTANLLIPFLKSSYTDCRLYAAYGLGLLGKHSVCAIHELTPLLNDQDLSVRFWASTAILQMGAEAKPYLVDILAHIQTGDENSLYNIFELLASLGGIARPAFDFLQVNSALYVGITKYFVDKFICDYTENYINV